MDLKSTPIKAGLRGSYRPPSDKSISHRLALLSGLCAGTSKVEAYLNSADTLATLAAMEALGAKVVRAEGEHGLSLEITGGDLKVPTQALDFGNSGTGIRLAAGLLAGLGHMPGLNGHTISLVGDESLSHRPMQRIVRPLAAQGAAIESTDGHAPLLVTPQRLKGHTHKLAVASAQVKSAILLAGLHAEGRTTVQEPGPSRDHTERLFEAFGVRVERGADHTVSVMGGQTLRAGNHEVPGDLSSASFIMAAALLAPNSEVNIQSVGLNPSRAGILRIIDAMGGHLEQTTETQVGAEPVGAISVKASQIKGVEVPAEWVPLAIDEFPILMGMAALAQGETVISGASELRVKESDRIALMCSELKKLGVVVNEQPDGAIIRGGQVSGGVVESGGDHRIAMTFAVLGLVAKAPIVIRDAHWMETSYPGFVDDLNALGGQLVWQS